jgi:hypothetical protein
VAQYLLQSLNAVKQWVRHYKDEGIDGLKEKQRSGRPSKARNQNHTKLLQSIAFCLKFFLYSACASLSCFGCLDLALIQLNPNFVNRDLCINRDDCIKMKVSMA